MARDNAVRFVVITPERQVLEQTTDSVVFTAHDGETGVLHGRAPLMCELGIGQLRYRVGDEVRRLFIDGGFAQVYEDAVTVLTQQAIPAEKITAEVVAGAERAVGEVTGTTPEAMDARRAAQQRVRVLRALRAGD